MAETTVIVKQSNLKNILKRLPCGSVVAGITKSAGNYPSGESVVSVGWKNEIGDESPSSWTGHKGQVSVTSTPQRSFVRSTFKENRKKWVKDVANNIQFLLNGMVKPEAFVESLGSVMESAIKQKIIDIKEPHNSPQVSKDKGFDNPLIDTGRMIQSVTHEARDD